MALNAMLGTASKKSRKSDKKHKKKHKKRKKKKEFEVREKFAGRLNEAKVSLIVPFFADLGMERKSTRKKIHQFLGPDLTSEILNVAGSEITGTTLKGVSVEKIAGYIRKIVQPRDSDDFLKSAKDNGNKAA